MKFVYVIQAGGVEETVTPDFDIDAALDREYVYAFVKLKRELEKAGRVTRGAKLRVGDYTRQVVVIDLDDDDPINSGGNDDDDGRGSPPAMLAVGDCYQQPQQGAGGERILELCA